MDEIVLLLMMAVTALSYIEPNWKTNEPAAWMQVYTMSCGLAFLGMYMMGRPAFR